MKKRRVVITGIGVVSPNGIGKENAWQGMSSGKSGVKLVDSFDVSMFNTRIAAEVEAVTLTPNILGFFESRGTDRRRGNWNIRRMGIDGQSMADRWDPG